jgi:hypothetical protein
MKTVMFKFFIGEQVWYRAMNRVGDVVACTFSRNSGYTYMLRIAYQEKWQYVECAEEELLAASERLDQLLNRNAVPSHSPDGSLLDTKDARTEQ